MISVKLLTGFMGKVAVQKTEPCTRWSAGTAMAARCSRDMMERRNIDAVVMQIRREIAEASIKAADECNEPPLDEQG
jgi:hypothetical protein